MMTAKRKEQLSKGQQKSMHQINMNNSLDSVHEIKSTQQSNAIEFRKKQSSQVGTNFNLKQGQMKSKIKISSIDNHKIHNIVGIDSPRISNINPIKIQQKLHFEEEDEAREDDMEIQGIKLPFTIKNLDTGEVSNKDPYIKQGVTHPLK